MSLINYKDWFYKYHQYLNGNDNTFVDTKWNNINERLINLIRENSDLIGNQPYAVVGNNYGIESLINLMQSSDYKFYDINDALVQTYNSSYKNSMSRMVVNTHAIIGSFTNKDKHVRYDATTNYFIIDVPYDQLPFKDRDEMVRQRLQQMHVTSTNVWIPLADLNTIPIYNTLLGFGIMITMNGLISNDCLVAFDEKGMMFKVRWTHPTGFECIVYKFDVSNVYSFDIDSQNVIGSNINIPWDKIPNANYITDGTTLKGIVDIYYPEFISSVEVPGNFCTIDKDGIHIPNVQSNTVDMIATSKIQNVHFIVYEMKYFHELPNIYPAMNYYNMMSDSLVKVNDDIVKNISGNNVYAKSNETDYRTYISTPPILIDRDVTSTYQIPLNIVADKTRMLQMEPFIVRIGLLLQSEWEGENLELIKTIDMVYPIIEECRSNYMKFATLTSMVEQSQINLFDRIFKDISSVNYFKHSEVLHNLRPDIYYSGYWDSVIKLYSVLEHGMFKTIKNINKIPTTFIEKASPTRFNRPVSEQCFITMKYDMDANVWRFTNPNIRHFNGIQNAFYINNGITGNEVFKFFVLYTDTENPAEHNVEPLTEQQIFDYDLFCKEVVYHTGYIKYWNAENKLMKISKMFFHTYDGNTCVNILSKMLKHKIDDSLLTDYPSDINYEASGISTLGEGNEDDLIAPFTINYLFYTLNLCHNKDDDFISYFLYCLTHNDYTPRYDDIDITEALNKEEPSLVNYSMFYTVPTTIDGYVPMNGKHVYNGYPFIVDSSKNITNKPYPYVFNNYDSENVGRLIDDNQIDQIYYISHTEATKNIYSNDIELARLLLEYTTMLHDNLATLATDYNRSFNQHKQLTIFKNDIIEYRNRVMTFINTDPELYLKQTELDIVDTYVNNDTLTSMISNIVDIITNNVYRIPFNGKRYTLYGFIQEFINVIHNQYMNYGFKDGASPRAKSLYEHLKKYTYMTSYDVLRWIDEIDYDFINNIESYLADNTTTIKKPFTAYITTFNYIKTTTRDSIENLNTQMIELLNKLPNILIAIKSHCKNIIDNYIFDMYRMNIEIDPIAMNKPLYATFSINDQRYTKPPVAYDYVENMEIVLYPKYDGTQLVSLHPTAEYVFFHGEPLDVTIKVQLENGTTTVNGHITFTYVGNTAHMMDDVQILNSILNTKVDVTNNHTIVDVVDDKINTNEYAEMHYELLIGNRFDQLSHVSEMVLDRTAKIPKMIDRMYISNQTINNYSIEKSKYQSPRMYFKPSQVLHIKPNSSNEITSVSGGYHVGQKIYLSTLNNTYHFPVIITKVDHSISHGFIEAVVSPDAKWFEVSDKTTINKLLLDDVECVTIPDNISNYLNEYNDPTLPYYAIPNISSVSSDKRLSFPGDPLFVQDNSDYVYCRLNWILNENVDNRFIDDKHKKYHFTYIGEYQLNGGSPGFDDRNAILGKGIISKMILGRNEQPGPGLGSSFRIKMINHNMDTLSLAEKYPTLRQEPNDHDIWDKEINEFNARINATQLEVDKCNNEIKQLEQELEEIITPYERDRIQRLIDDVTYKRDYRIAFIERLQHYIVNLESPSKWYNVNSYDAALVYIDNGRAETASANLVEYITDLPYTDKLEIFMYDAISHKWIDPNNYSITPNIVSGIKTESRTDPFNETGEAITSNVLHSIDVVFNTEIHSNKLLVYIAYDKSDVFDTIVKNPSTCNVKFKPLLSIDRTKHELFGDINVRKHYDGHEHYNYPKSNLPPDFDDGSTYRSTVSRRLSFPLTSGELYRGCMVTRPKPSGLYSSNPVYRFKDIEINNLSYENFDFYIPIEFKDIKTIRSATINQYECNVVVPVDSYEPNTEMTIMALNPELYTGNISLVTFNAISGNDDTQTFTITECSNPHIKEGTYTCTVINNASSAYKSCGGLIVVTVVNQVISKIKNNNWIKLIDPKYHIVPEVFIAISNSITQPPYDVIIKNGYYNTETFENDEMYKYYYDTKHHVRYPISDTTHNDHNTRLTIDTTLNPNVSIIRSPYIGICRYSLNTIPEHGVIDMTGKIPTPLSRDRYEFWVNGRCIKDPETLHILSPTAIQLCNLTSLHNFECIELVDDINTSAVIPRGNVYVDYTGKTYQANDESAFIKMMVNNHKIVGQQIDYSLFVSQNQPLYTYTESCVDNPNNHDIDENILTSLVIAETDTSYNALTNIPTINGHPLLHLTSTDLGFVEIDSKDVLKEYDKIWRRELITDPELPLHHTSQTNIPSIHIIPDITNDQYIISLIGNVTQYTTLYITINPDEHVSNTNTTIQVIPFIGTGSTIVLSGISRYKGKYVCTTIGSKPKKLN